MIFVSRFMQENEQTKCRNEQNVEYSGQGWRIDRFILLTGQKGNNRLLKMVKNLSPDYTKAKNNQCQRTAQTLYSTTTHGRVFRIGARCKGHGISDL